MNKNSSIDEMRDAVKAGAEWLDDNYPDWQFNINLSGLQMNLCTDCVIGQAVGEFYDTIETAAFQDGYSCEDRWAEDHGFQAPSHATYNEVRDNYSYAYDFEGESRYYKKLEELWTEEVKARFNRG